MSSIRRTLGRRRLGRAALAVGLSAAVAVPASPAAAATRFVSTVRQGPVTLTVTGTSKKEQGFTRYRNITSTLRAGSGKVVRTTFTGSAQESLNLKPKPRLADVSGDGRPDALVDTFSGGAHCCTVATIFVSTGKTTFAKPFRAAWDGGYRLRDLGTGDGVDEIVAVDQRFDYLFAAHAMSARPITIEHATAKGKLVDVSTQFPDRLRVDADEWIAAFRDLKAEPGETEDDVEGRGFAARSILAAALADLLRIGALDEAKALAAESVARGDFAHIPPKDEGIFDTDVAHQLQKLGFVDDWTVLGLPQ
ncbi:MAG: hypothetical protein PGN13_05055 [Patulibacter minatonensis]